MASVRFKHGSAMFCYNLALVRTLLTYAGESAWLSQAPGAGWQILARSQYDF